MSTVLSYLPWFEQAFFMARSISISSSQTNNKRDIMQTTKCHQKEEVAQYMP